MAERRLSAGDPLASSWCAKCQRRLRVGDRVVPLAGGQAARHADCDVVAQPNVSRTPRKA